MIKVTQTNAFLVDFFFKIIKESIDANHNYVGSDDCISIRFKENGYDIEIDGTCEDQNFIFTSIGGYNEELETSFEFEKEHIDAIEYEFNK